MLISIFADWVAAGVEVAAGGEGSSVDIGDGKAVGVGVVGDTTNGVEVTLGPGVCEAVEVIGAGDTIVGVAVWERVTVTAGLGTFTMVGLINEASVEIDGDILGDTEVTLVTWFVVTIFLDVTSLVTMSLGDILGDIGEDFTSPIRIPTTPSRFAP